MSGRAEWFAVAGLGLAVVTSGVLIGLGLWRQAEAPESVVQTRLVHFSPGPGYGQVRALASVYRPAGADASAGLAGTTLTPTLADPALKESFSRLVWNDRDAWQFELMDLPPGVVHQLSLGGIEAVPIGQAVTLSVTDGQIVGKLPQPVFESNEDWLLATPTGHYAIQTDSNGSFTIPTGPGLPEGTYVSSGVLSDQQAWRSRVIEELLSQPGWPTEPVLLAWQDDNETSAGLSLTSVTQQRSVSLQVQPLSWASVPTGTSFELPEALLPFRPSDRHRASTIFDFQQGGFVENVSNPAEVWFRFDLPEALRPARLERVAVTIELDAPQRMVRLLAGNGKSENAVEEFTGPTGRQVIELIDDHMPTLEDNGSIYICIDVDRGQDPMSVAPAWTLRDVAVRIEAVKQRDSP